MFLRAGAAVARVKVVVASQSSIKGKAVQAVFPKADVIGVKTSSGVPEQPCGDETGKGARNRIQDARQQIQDADYYVAIENGIYNESGHWIDKAVVIVINKAGDERVEMSIGVEFPKEYVEKAKAIGFEKVTVGSVMFDAGIIRQKDDPHADLGDKKPRADMLKETIAAAVKHLNRHPGMCSIL